MSGAGLLPHPSEGLEVSISSQIARVNEAPLHYQACVAEQKWPGICPGGAGFKIRVFQ